MKPIARRTGFAAIQRQVKYGESMGGILYVPKSIADQFPQDVRFKCERHMDGILFRLAENVSPSGEDVAETAISAPAPTGNRA